MGRKGSIRLHPQHGLNPTLSLCFYCGQETGEIALLGAAYKGEAPRQMVTGLVPCAACLRQWGEEGVALVEVEERVPQQQGPGRPPSKPQQIPTGRWVVVKRDGLRHIITGMEITAEKKVFLLTKEVWERIMPKEAE